MKISNRILLALVMFLVMVPVLMLLGFNRKIANKDFTVEKYSWSVNTNKEIPLKPARFIKLQAPDSTDMNCQLAYGAVDHYQMNGYNTDDSLAVEQHADTLFFRFIPATRGAGYHDVPEMNFRLYLSAVPQVFADGVDLTVDSIGQSDTLQVHLVNKSSIELGNEEPGDHLMQYGRIALSAENSEIKLYPRLSLQSLTVNLKGNSLLDIDKAAKIGAVNGTVSANSMVNGPASYMYQLLFNND